MTFLECCHSLVLCPGVRRPRRRPCVCRWSSAWCAPDRGARGDWPTRYERPAPARAAHMREALAPPTRRRAGTRMHAAARPHAGTFSKGAAKLPSGQLRRDAPVSWARRGVAGAGGARRTSRRSGHGNAEVADQGEAHFTEPDRRGTRGAAKAKSTQDGLTVSGHQGPDNNHLALGVAVRQWGCGARSRVRRLGSQASVRHAFAGALCRQTRWRARVRKTACLARGAATHAPENRSHAPGRFACRRRPGITSNQPHRHLMSLQFKSLYRALCLAIVAQAASASNGGVSGLKPSDCRPRDADSTCATAVASAPVSLPLPIPDEVIIDSSLGGVPSSGYAYWGFDFASALAGIASPFPDDMFVNRSPYPVTITLSFTIPTTHACGNNCLPGVQFEVDAHWINVRPPIVVNGNSASASYQARPGQGYGWAIGLWQASNARLTATLPPGAHATLEQVGLPSQPSIATEIPAVTGVCDCWDGSSAACSLGNRFSNGLMGPWYRSTDFYLRAGAFNGCPPER